MKKTNDVYVGELVRKHIKDSRLTNGYVISALVKREIEMSDATFSNKLYGVRNKFNNEEVEAINAILGTSFELPQALVT